jgi:hypothetical protein
MLTYIYYIISKEPTRIHLSFPIISPIDNDHRQKVAPPAVWTFGYLSFKIVEDVMDVAG